MSDQYVHISDAAAMAGVTPSAIYQRIRSGKLSAIEKDGFRMLVRSEVQAYAARKNGHRKGTSSGSDGRAYPLPPPSINGEVRAVFNYLENRISDIDNELVGYSTQIRQLETEAEELMREQDACRESLKNLKKVTFSGVIPEQQTDD